MAGEDQQLMRFTKADSLKIETQIKSLTKSDALEKFKDLASVITESTGLLPAPSIPALQRVSGSYSTINAKVIDGLAQAGAVLNKFVVKSAKVIERGFVSPADAVALAKMGKQLNCDFVGELLKFSDESRKDLISIYDGLLVQSGGETLKNLLKKKEEKENEIVSNASAMTGIANRIGAKLGKIASYAYDVELNEKAIKDSEAMKEETRQELKKLKAQIPEYEKAIQDHRDTAYEERGSFWLFSWKVRDVHVDNGERIARENLTSLKARINSLETTLANWSTENFEKRKKEALEETPKLEKELEEDRKAYEFDEKKHTTLEGEFNSLVKEIEDIYARSGSRDEKSVAQIDTLARAIFDASLALQKAFGVIQTHLESIDADADPDFLVSSVVDALTILGIGDQYTGTARIANLKMILSITEC